MIRPGFEQPAVLDNFRRMFRAARYRHVTVPSLFEPEAAAALRARVTGSGLTSFWVADRGRYQTNLSFSDETLFDQLRGFAEAVIEAPLLPPAGARWLRFRRGDYQLIRGDAVERAEPGRHLELTLDLSTGETDQSEIVYSDGAESFVVPQWAGSLTLVERVDSLYRYERYLNHLVGEAEVWRLRLSFRFAS